MHVNMVIEAWTVYLFSVFWNCYCINNYLEFFYLKWLFYGTRYVLGVSRIFDFRFTNSSEFRASAFLNVIRRISDADVLFRIIAQRRPTKNISEKRRSEIRNTSSPLIFRLAYKLLIIVPVPTEIRKFLSQFHRKKQNQKREEYLSSICAVRNEVRRNTRDSNSICITYLTEDNISQRYGYCLFLWDWNSGSFCVLFRLPYSDNAPTY